MISLNRADVRRSLARCALILAAAIVIIAVTTFPYDLDHPLSAEDAEASRQYYAEAYKTGDPTEAKPASECETRYIRSAAEAAKRTGMEQQVSDFASKYRLGSGAVLDIGSGRGYLQDIVNNYTGLDISSSVSRFYHKKFVLGSATAMPFPDNSFDGGWSIWVFEHVPDPEQALVEMRRVMKNNAIFFLYPAWNCTSWAAEGYDVRSYSDFDLRGKLVKAGIPVRKTLLFRAAALIPARTLRNAISRFGPTRLHYRRLLPNYKYYWEPDRDAVNGIDHYEMGLWFCSRGDECLNCGGLSSRSAGLVIRIHK